MIRTLPADSPQKSASAPQPPAAAVRQTGRRVLVVDDNHDAATTLAMLLRAAGHETMLAHDGQEALAKLAGADRTPPHVALLDIGLPGMDGYELAARMRQLRPEICLAAVSGYGQPEDFERSHAAGFDYHFVKPVDPTRLLEVIGGLQ
jgi:CheY-like chemotaxis protein